MIPAPLDQLPLGIQALIATYAQNSAPHLRRVSKLWSKVVSRVECYQKMISSIPNDIRPKGICLWEGKALRSCEVVSGGICATGRDGTCIFLNTQTGTQLSDTPPPLRAPGTLTKSPDEACRLLNAKTREELLDSGKTKSYKVSPNGTSVLIESQGTEFSLYYSEHSPNPSHRLVNAEGKTLLSLRQPNNYEFSPNGTSIWVEFPYRGLLFSTQTGEQLGYWQLLRCPEEFRSYKTFNSNGTRLDLAPFFGPTLVRGSG